MSYLLTLKTISGVCKPICLNRPSVSKPVNGEGKWLQNDKKMGNSMSTIYSEPDEHSQQQMPIIYWYSREKPTVFCTWLVLWDSHNLCHIVCSWGVGITSSSYLPLAVSFSEVDVVAVGAVHVEVDLTDVRREPPRQVPHLLQEMIYNWVLIILHIDMLMHLGHTRMVMSQIFRRGPQFYWAAIKKIYM